MVTRSPCPDTAGHIIGPRLILASWIGVGTVLSLLAALLAWASPLFSYDYDLKDLPALPLAAGLSFAGLIFLILLPLIRTSLLQPPKQQRRILMVILAFGVILRALLLWSEPALEDDYQRYMWDGAVTANGLNPYARSPKDAAKQPPGSLARDLVEQSAPVHERINHAYLKTIYPPVTQGAFALAYLIKPWSLIAWRLVVLLGEGATLGLLLLLLREAGRSPLWMALYWWNPVVVKELINSAHMEAIVTPFVLAAFLAAIRGRLLASTTALGFAMGAKIWPAMLAPLIWRSAVSKPKVLAFCVLLLAALAVLWALPPWLGGIDKTSGFVAYAQRWKTGSALFPQIEALAHWLLRLAGLPTSWAPLGARGVLAAVFGLAVLALAWRPISGTASGSTSGSASISGGGSTGSLGSAEGIVHINHAWLTPSAGNPAAALDLMRRAGLAVAVLLLLSPSQFPWYSIWLAPFLCFMPSIGLLVITAMIPLYYTAFYFIAIDQKEVFRNSITWIIWLPVWTMLLGEIYWRRTAWRRWGRGNR